jgi:hypothetical protein
VVPFAITSNSYIARQYANIALPMLPEVSPICCGDPDCAQQPLYVVELGAGQVRSQRTMQQGLGFVAGGGREVWTRA